MKRVQKEKKNYSREEFINLLGIYDFDMINLIIQIYNLIRYNLYNQLIKLATNDQENCKVVVYNTENFNFSV